MSADQHRAVAERVLSRLPGAVVGEETLALASEATARALLALEARLGELVEQQRLGNVIAALGAVDEETLADGSGVHAAETYVRIRLADIIDPSPIEEL